MLASSVLLLVLCCCCLDVSGLEIYVTPKEFPLVPYGAENTAHVRLQLNLSDPADAQWALGSDGAMVTVTATGTTVPRLSNNTLLFDILDLRNGNNKTFNFTLSHLGHVYLDVHVYRMEEPDITTPADNFTSTSLPIRIHAAFSRQLIALDIAFRVIIGIMVVINNVNMGVQLDIEIIKSVFRKPIGPIVGFVSQFVFMPLFSYGMAYLLIEGQLFRLGLFVLGVSPGGVASNFWTLLLHGDVNLSITMTFISTIAAIGMMPLWLLTLGQTFLKGHHRQIRIPFANLIVSLVMLTVPLGVGILIKRKRPTWAHLSTRCIRPFTFLILVFILTVGVYNCVDILVLLTWKLLLAGFLVAAAGYLFGAGLALLFRLPLPQVVAISIETAFQNAGVAFLLLKVSLPEPDADLGSLAPIAQLLCTGPIVWVLFGVVETILFCRRRMKNAEMKIPQKENELIYIGDQKEANKRLANYKDARQSLLLIAKENENN